MYMPTPELFWVPRIGLQQLVVPIGEFADLDGAFDLLEFAHDRTLLKRAFYARAAMP
jgi:hypothetical protein